MGWDGGLESGLHYLHSSTLDIISAAKCAHESAVMSRFGRETSNAVPWLRDRRGYAKLCGYHAQPVGKAATRIQK
jgi:hypothetical protein